MKNQTLNKWMLGAALSVTTLFANASVINYDTLVTGADMAGLDITLNTATGTESLSWVTTSTMLDTAPSVLASDGVTPLTPAQIDIYEKQGESGGVSSTDWSLTQQGYTNLDFDGPVLFGLWTFEYTGTDPLVSLVLDAMGTDFVFDTDAIDNTANTSGVGAPFTIAGTSPVASYSNQVDADELYKTVTIDFDAQSPTSFSFWLDVDKAMTSSVNVSEPSMFIVLLSGLALVVRRKYNTK